MLWGYFVPQCAVKGRSTACLDRYLLRWRGEDGTDASGEETS